MLLQLLVQAIFYHILFLNSRYRSNMQQNQEIHKDADWQDKMVEIEMRVSDMDGYKDIAFFHHLIIEKK